MLSPHDWLARSKAAARATGVGPARADDGVRLIATLLLLAAAYVAAGKIGLALAQVNPSASAVWPPAGIALASLLIVGLRACPAVFAGAFIVNQLTAGSWATSLAIAGGNTLEALLGAVLVNRFAGGPSGLKSGRTLFAFAAAALISATVGATGGSAALLAGGLASSAEIAGVWVTWWLGDASGAMLVAPVLLLWHAEPRPGWSAAQRAEILVLGIATIAVAWTVFIEVTYPLPFLCIPLFIWAGLRFGQREASTVAFLASGIAVWGTLRGFGSLGAAPLNAQLLLLQSFMATGTLVGLVVGAAHAELEARVEARTDELRSAVERLRLSEARLAEAQEVAHIGSWEWRVEENQVWWSDEIYRVFGLDRQTFLPGYDEFLARVHPDDRAAIDAANQNCFARHVPFEVEHRIVRPDGEVRTIVSKGRASLDNTGHLLRVLGTAQDITERKAAQEIVARSERRLHTIIDAEPACVKLVSEDGVLLEMNRAGLVMLGAETAAQVVGRPIIDLVRPEDQRRFLEAHRAASVGGPSRCEFRIRRLDGGERWVDSHLVPFEAAPDAGAQRAVLSVTTDVTERKRLEDDLRHSQKVEAVGLLAGGIAHDFNNLLTAIGGFTDMVLATFRSDDSRRDDLQEVAKAAHRAAALTRQLLAVSRRQILQPTVLDVNAMVASVQKLLHRTIPENIQLRLELSPALEPVRADRGQLEQVLLNLAINAGDAMPQGGQLRLATETVIIEDEAARRHPQMPPGTYARLTVSDTGVGMTPEIQARIFEPFFTTKDRGKGTGLGLATVYGIVKQSGGFIWVESEPGHGTTFEIDLPVVHEAVEPPAETLPPVEYSGGSQTILIAEDDGAVRRLARDVLARHGYTVLDARDGEEALALARKRRGEIHLLITDVVMPGLSGRDLAARVGAERPGVRVLYTSGYTENVMTRAGFEKGLALLPKPFLPADLLRKVGETLGAPAGT